MSTIKLAKPRQRWLFGGIGFHNSEATMTPIMSEEFKNQRVLKTFREISPTFARVFAGYADWTKQAMDDFADYYDATFRKAGTLLYLVPGRMPWITEDFDIQQYSEQVASNLEYLLMERNCVKIRYYHLTNELAVGNRWGWFNDKLELFKSYHECLYKAFRRHHLQIGLMATDTAQMPNLPQIEWAANNMDEITDTYCMHMYTGNYDPGDLSMYPFFHKVFSGLVETAAKKEKRFVLGEYGFTGRRDHGAMGNDTSYSVCVPEKAALAAISRAEVGMAAMNAGCLSALNWTLFDYPDPYIREDGDSPEEKARYQVARFSGHGLQFRYNKNGLVRWCDEERDYSAYPSLYTMGLFAKLFRKGGRLLAPEIDDETLRAVAQSNPDGSMSVAVINWGAGKDVVIDSMHPIDKPLRQYVYDSANPPVNAANDLQGASELVSAKDNAFKAWLPANSMTFFTTDYVDRKPTAIHKLSLKDGVLTWVPCQDAEHCYYRIYKDKTQIASTVAESLNVNGGTLKDYQVCSVDKYGNV